MKRYIASRVLAVAMLCLLAAYSNAQDSRSDYSDRGEAAQLHQLADALRLPIPADTELRSEGNFIGFRSKEALFSRRIDSRTYFVQSLTTRGLEKESEAYQAPENVLRQRPRQILQVLEIPANEILNEKILQEQLREGQFDGQTKRVMLEPLHPGARWASASRQIEGIPIFSSRIILRLKKDGTVDFLEIHWPDIPREVLVEAHRLAYKVKAGWHPPDLPGARVESAEAGVVHSPAIGFVMDFYPAIRVIYSHSEKGLGKKAVKYLDRNGHEIPSPRQFAVPPEPVEAKAPVRRPKKR